MMFTRCPECRTRFYVTVEDLRNAQAYVRCGECDMVFSALETLSARDDEPAEEGHEAGLAPPLLKLRQAPEQLDEPGPLAEALGDDTPTVAAPEEPQTTTDVASDDGISPPPTPSEAYGTDAFAPPDLPAIEPNSSPPRSGGDDATADSATADVPPSAPMPSPGAPPPGTALTPGSAMDWRSSQEAKTVEFDLSEITGESGGRAPIEQVIWSDEDDPEAAPVVSTLQIDLPLPGSTASATPAAEAEAVEETIFDDDEWGDLSYDQDAHDDGISDAEDFILDERTEPEEPEPSGLNVRAPEFPSEAEGDRSTPWWLAAVAVLGALLAAQFALSTSAGFEFRCRTLGCTDSTKRDLTRIAALSTNVQRHPGIEGALLISATLRNDAPFPQPYPLVEVKLLDVQGDVIALRRFKPTEYVNDSAERAKGVMPEVLVPLVFEVVDPGIDAVTFEFDFL